MEIVLAVKGGYLATGELVPPVPGVRWRLLGSWPGPGRCAEGDGRGRGALPACLLVQPLRAGLALAGKLSNSLGSG